jgi:hypothetical protein
MSEIEFGDQTYRTGRLHPKQQFHVMRRLAPVLSAASNLFEAMGATAGDEPVENAELNLTSILRTAGPIIEAIGALSDEQADYVVNTCLSVCQRRQDNGAWANVYNANTGIMFDDMDLPTMLQLCWHVISENLQSFFNVSPSTSGMSGVVRQLRA